MLACVPPEYNIHGRAWGKGLVAELMQRTQGASSSGQCKLQGGLGCQALGGRAWEPR